MKLPPPVFMPSGQPMVWVTWPCLWFSGRTSHSSFMPRPNFCGSRPSDEIELGDDLLGQRAAHAFGDEDIFAEQFHAGLEVGLGLAVLADAHHAGDHAPDRAVLAVEHFGTGEARIDLDAQAFRLLRQPAADIAERDGIVAVIVHERRHQRNWAGAARPEGPST